jgi:hypothetical protein
VLTVPLARTVRVPPRRVGFPTIVFGLFFSLAFPVIFRFVTSVLGFFTVSELPRMV